jgi:hypothetical protein
LGVTICAEGYTDSVTITPKGTRAADNSYAYDGTPVATTARVVHKSGVRHHASREEYAYTLVVYFKSGETLALGDQLTISSVKHRIREIIEHSDVTGTLDHYEVYVGGV